LTEPTDIEGALENEEVGLEIEKVELVDEEDLDRCSGGLFVL